LTEALVLLAYERWVLGDKTTPPALLEASLTYAKEAEHAVDIAIAVCSQGYLALQQHELATARSLFEQSLTMMKSMWAFSSLIAKGKWICACSLEGLGQIAFAQQQTRWAVLLLSVAQRVRTAKGYTLPLGMLPFSADTLLASARAQLGGTDVAATWAVGQAMTIEQVLAAEESSSPPSQLAKAVEEIPSLTSLFSQPHRLTEREMEVLALIVQSFTNHQIATTLKIRASTVSTHVQSIYAKLGVTSRSAATRYALEHHLT
jgi:DNA-binding NarL/FixJ family response regulator